MSTSAPVVITAGERLDGLRALALRQELDAAVAGPRRIVVDLADTAHVDGVGLAALVHGWRAARRAGGELVLVRPRQEGAWRIFRLTAFDTVFGTEPATTGRDG